jgi:hypothetical protein
MPMDAEMTSNNADTLGLTREHYSGSLGLCDWDSVDMDALFNDLDSMDTSTGNDCQMDTSVENDGPMEVPLSVDDYQQLEHGCQVEAQPTCMNPQYGTHQLLYAIVSFLLSSYRNHT